MGLTRFAIARPVAILMFIGAFIVLGLVAFFKLPAELNPQVDFPTVTIYTTYTAATPEANPQEMETLITKVIEDSISGVSGVKQINSTSQEGVSVVTVQFFFGTDLNEADAEVIQKVDAVRRALPTAADAPAVIKADTSSQPVMYLTMQSKIRSPKELLTIAKNIVTPQIEQAVDVGNVSAFGGDNREIHVDLVPDKLAAYGLTVTDVANALNNANVNVASGFAQHGDQYYGIRIVGEFASVDEVRNVKLNIKGNSFYLKDLATISDTIQENTTDSYMNGTRSVSFVIQKTSDGNTLNAVASVKTQLATLKKYLPPDIYFTPTIDFSVNVENNLHDVVVSLFLGALLAILVVYTFLHNFRGTIIIALALPTSMIATFAALYACNFTLNTMTLLGLSLSVGILIDDAIVVLENISRHLALGEEPTQAAINGRSEIGMAAITLTTVDLVVFLPIAFMGGVIGEFFRSFGVTVACATFFSLMVSFTLTPMLAARWYKKGESFEYHTGFAGWFDSHFFAFEKFYQGILKNLLSRWWRPWIVVAVGFAFLIAVVVTVVPKIGFRFSPDQDQNQVNISVQGPAGASLDYTHVIVNRIQNIIRTTPDLNRDTKFILTSEGKSARGQGNGITGTQYATVLLVLYDRSSFLDTLTFWHHEHLRPRSDIDVALELRKLTGKIPGARILCSNVSGFGGGGPPLEVDLTAPDFNQLLDASNRVEALVRSTPGTYNTDISYQNSEPEVQIRLDRVRVTQYGLDLQTVSNAVSDAVAGNISSYYRDPNDGEEYYIRVELAKNYRDNPTYMGALIVGYQNGAPVHLSDVANITFAAGPVKIDRLNRVHEIAVTAYLLPGYQVGNISTALGAKLSKMNLGQVGFTFGGEAQSLSDEGGYLITALLLGIILSYMLMAALFDNALYPISIMGALPQAWGGALIALYIAKEPLNLIAMIGVVLLNGIVNKNAILLVDYTNTLRKRGYTRADALSEAGPVRLRPIMMTSIAILMSSLPTALALGRGAGFRQSLGVVVIGGVCLSTFLTLLVIPCAYTIFDTFQEWFGRMKRRLLKLDRDEDDFGGGGLREPYSRKGSDDPLAGITADGRKPDNIAP